MLQLDHRTEPESLRPPSITTTRPLQASARVGAVIVAYFPELDALRRVLEIALPQLDHVVIVDNTPEDGAGARLRAALPTDARVEVIAKGRNIGLAAAQNVGIARLRALGLDYVLLLDQDSMPTAGMVAALLEAHEALAQQGRRVAAVGPRWVDKVTGKAAAFVRLGLGRMRTVVAAHGERVVECDALVASGCLIPMAVIHDVGDMDEGLFIDHVDNEWGVRAQRRGYGLFGSHNAQLQHGIGEHRVRVWVGRWRNVSVHQPLRDYYKLRNTLVVFFFRPAPWRWRLYCAATLGALSLVSLALLPQRRERLSKMLAGVRDALSGRMGAYRDPATDRGSAVRVYAGSPARQLLRRVWKRFSATQATTWPVVRAEVEGRNGVEIGGPSPIFQAEGALPVYTVANRIDNCNFSKDTLWETSDGQDAPFSFDKRRGPGRQFISEATALHQVPDGSCAFVLSSHALEHSANPLKALLRWRAVLRPGGALVLVLPHKDATFDHRRPVTPLAHLVADFEADMAEDDETHLPEILALHDLERDEWAGGRDQFVERSRQNLRHRGLHHHVFDSQLAASVVNWAGLQIEAMEARLPMDIIVLARKPLPHAVVDNEAFLRNEAAHLAASPFATDRPAGSQERQAQLQPS